MVRRLEVSAFGRAGAGGGGGGGGNEEQMGEERRGEIALYILDPGY
jgi:hypothetical protein